MSLNINELKREAREHMRNSRTSPYIVSFAYLVINYILGSIFVYFKSSSDTSVIFWLISFVLQCVNTTINTGFSFWALSVARNNDDTDEFFFAFKNILPIILIHIVRTAFISIGSLLLILPGIIVALGLSMSQFCFRDAVEFGFFEAIKDSWNLMKGNKLTFLVLWLSFIPWLLLTLVTFGLASIYVLPYMSVTIAKFYDEIY